MSTSTGSDERGQYGNGDRTSWTASNTSKGPVFAYPTHRLTEHRGHPQWAERQAAKLLPELGDRWLHVQAVAARANEVAAAVAPEDRSLLVAAAWVHDIGDAPRLALTGFHPVDGARYVRDQGREELARLVAHHSGACFEAEERGMVAALAEFEPVDGPVMDALICADMTTGPAGQCFTFDQRIEEILSRYQADDPVHRAISRSRPTLGRAVERTQRRLGVSVDQPM